MKKSSYTCVECGASFEAAQPAKYCTAACKAKHINHAKATFQCVYCGKLFEGSRQNKPRFCSNKCAADCRKEIVRDPDSPLAKYMSVKTDKREYERVCVVCGTHFKTTCSTAVNRHCPLCAASYGKRWYLQQKMWNESARRMPEHELRAGIDAQKLEVKHTESVESKSSSQTPHKANQTREETNARRRYRRAQLRALGLLRYPEGPKTRNRNTYLDDNPECICCGYADDRDALQVHHIDMNRTNNTDDNLCTLCANCHSIIHQRIKRNLGQYEDSSEGIKDELYRLKAELKSRNQAGKPDMATRTEGWQ